MKLSKLILHGFKSFADRTEISFTGGVTGVVGPNGCGKSNIADAVRWVLGEQSARTLRGTKMEDVIFNGTETRRRVAFCEVSLVFDNSDHALPLEFSEVQVTRRLYRSGESEYSLNGSECRRSDILDLFRNTGIGKEGYSIIGQGRIDEILSQKGEDRRAVFEEAAGITRFRYRREDAEKRIAHTRENRVRVDDILAGLTERVEPLRKQSETAREYTTLREEQKKLDLNCFLVRSRSWTEKIRELTAEDKSVQEAIRDAEASLEKLSSSQDEAQSRLAEEEAVSADAREEVQRAISLADEKEGEKKLLNEKSANAGKEKERLTRDLDTARGGEESTRASVMKLESLLAGEKAELERRKVLRDEAEQATREAEEAARDLEAREQAEEQQLIDDMNRLSDKKSREASLSTMEQALTSRWETDQAELAKEEKAGLALQEHVKEEQERATQAKDAVQKAENAAREAEQAADRARVEADRLRQVHSEKDVALKQSESRLKLLEEMQRDFEGYQGSVRQVMLQARRTPGSGVHGVVADLIRVPAKLERAMDMALGAALQNIVVDRDEDAKRMIDYLRVNRLGRATFLPIGSIRGRVLSQSERRVLNMPGCLGLASELVESDGIYRGIVDSLLGRTVIAEDLEKGIAIQRAGGYQFRLVTLEGDVMHSGGSMTGGSIQSRATSLLSRGREIADTKEALARSKREAAEAEQKIKEADEARQSARDARSRYLNELSTRRVEAAHADEQLTAARNEANSHAARLGNLKEALQDIESQLLDIRREMAELTESADVSDSAQEDRQETVLRLQDELRAAREKAQTAAQRLTDEKVACAALEKSVEASGKELERLRGMLGQSATFQQETEEKLRQAEQTLAGLSIEQEEAARAAEAAASSLAAARKQFDDAEKARGNTQKRIQSLMREAEACRTQAEEATVSHHKLEMQTAKVESDLKGLTDRIWEDYTLTLADAEKCREEDFRLTEADKRLTEIRTRIKGMGSVNLSALDEYRETVARVTEMTAQREDLVRAEEDLEKLIRELNGSMDKRFREKMDEIDRNFRRMFTSLFGGGQAEIRLEEGDDPLECGIEIVAQPPGKKLVSLSLLSGGERALTAIALLFAMLDINPSPFCILDEIEAALDDANIDNYAEFMKDYSKNTQFVVITHRKGTMERCDELYGVVMQEKGISRTVSVTLEEAEG